MASCKNCFHKQQLLDELNPYYKKNKKNLRMQIPVFLLLLESNLCR